MFLNAFDVAIGSIITSLFMYDIFIRSKTGDVYVDMMHSTSSQWLQPLSHSPTTRFPASGLPFNHLHQNLPTQSSPSIMLASQITSSEPLFPLSNTFSVDTQPGTFLAGTFYAVILL